MRTRFRLLPALILAALIAAAPAVRAAEPAAPKAAEEAAPAPGGILVPPVLLAYWLWQQGTLLHLAEEYDDAIALFRQSIAILPTAEAHTFLGWSLSKEGRFREAIGECRKAIALDPDFGNPYNDIGVYLMELGRSDEAVPWLRKAMRAERYCCYQFPHFNYGRILLGRGRIEEARRAFERALELAPDYPPAREALEQIRERALSSL